MTNLSITASNARPSKCVDTTGAVDVDVTVTIPGETSHHCSVCGGPVEDDGSRACEHTDADVTTVLEHQPVTVAGEVTLCPQQYDGRLASWGDCADVWVSGALLQALRAAYSGEDFRRALLEIEAHAAEVA